MDVIRRLRPKAEVLRRVVGQYFTQERRDRYARRLLDAAYVVHLAGGRDQELAPLLRGMAETLADPGREAETHPLAMMLFLRCFRDREEPKEAPEADRIVRLAEPGLTRPATPRERS